MSARDLANDLRIAEQTKKLGKGFPSGTVRKGPRSFDEISGWYLRGAAAANWSGRVSEIGSVEWLRAEREKKEATK